VRRLSTTFALAVDLLAFPDTTGTRVIGLHPCATGQDTVASRLQYFEDIVTVLPAVVPNGIALPHRPAEGVSLVTDSLTCAAALHAYNHLPPDSVTGSVSRVVVLKVGNSRFVVSSPTEASGLVLYVVYDSTFQRLASVLH
jgi:hypothetical protein